jgi:hypothetical protein
MRERRKELKRRGSYERGGMIFMKKEEKGGRGGEGRGGERRE